MRGARYLHAKDRERVADELVDAALALTSVFDQNLPDVAVTIPLGVEACRARGRHIPLNIIACENMQNSSSTLGQHVRQHLNPEGLAYCNRYFGFPDCMISRVVPQPEADPLTLIAEDYNEWTVRRSEVKGDALAWFSALEAVDNQDARLERKLFMHNGGHATCGYFGFHYGHQFVHEAVADANVARRVAAACDQIGEVVCRKHGFPPDDIEAYKNDLYRRGAIPKMRDQILRVVRQPSRKLGGNERLLGPARLAAANGLHRHKIVEGIVAALKYQHAGDPQSMEMHQRIATEGVRALLERISQLSPTDTLLDEIEQAWKQWTL